MIKKVKQYGATCAIDDDGGRVVAQECNRDSIRLQYKSSYIYVKGIVPSDGKHQTGLISSRLWNDLPPELRTISLPPPPSLQITRHHLHPPPLSVTPGPSTQN